MKPRFKRASHTSATNDRSYTQASDGASTAQLEGASAATALAAPGDRP